MLVNALYIKSSTKTCPPTLSLGDRLRGCCLGVTAATEDYYKHPAGSPCTTWGPLLSQGRWPQTSSWGCLWACLSRQCQAALSLGMLRQLRLHSRQPLGPFSWPGKVIPENPHGRSSRTWLKAGKQEGAVGIFQAPSRTLPVLLHPVLAQEVDLSALLTRLPSLWPLGSPGRTGGRR